MLVKAHHSIRKVKCYYVLLYRVYDILSVDAPQLSREERLQSVVKAVNDTVGPDKLILILLVYSTYPYISREDKLTLLNIERARVIERVIDNVYRSNAKSAITKAIRTTRRLDVVAVLGLLLNVKVLVWRKKPKSQIGPQWLVVREGYIYKIDFDRKIIDMYITSIKPYKEINKKKELLEDTPSDRNLLICLTLEVSSIVGPLDA